MTKNNHYLMATRGVVNKITTHGFNSKVYDEEPTLRSNMISFEIYSENTDEDFFKVFIPKVFKEIKEKNLFNISYITYSIKGNGYWILYLILKENDLEVEEIIKETNKNQTNLEKLKELYFKTNTAIIEQKTRRKTCRTCDSVINLDAFFKNRKFKYKKIDEALLCPICESDTGFYSKTIQEKIKKLKD